MAATPTPRLKLPLPAETDPADVPFDVANLAGALDPVTVVFSQGNLSTRPDFGVPGQIFMATDTGTWWYDNGVGWLQLGGATPPSWVIPAYQNGWTAGNGTVPGYMKDPLGFTHLRGRIGGGVSGTVAFQLPPYFRPAGPVDLYPVGCLGGSGNPLPAFCAIDSLGNVVIYYGAGTSDMSIGGVSFLAEA
jgi:hypothetical protein